MENILWDIELENYPDLGTHSIVHQTPHLHIQADRYLLMKNDIFLTNHIVWSLGREYQDYIMLGA